jgi:hypothetical protein
MKPVVVRRHWLMTAGRVNDGQSSVSKATCSPTEAALPVGASMSQGPSHAFQNPFLNWAASF